MPGTSFTSRTMYAARDFFVPASVRSNPDPSENRTRSAIGDLPGRITVWGSASDQRSHPARARWKTRWMPSTSRSRNLPCRDQPSTIPPASAVGGGSKVLRTENDASSTLATARPSVRSARKSTSAWTSGSSGTASSSHPRCHRIASCRADAPPRLRRVRPGWRRRPCRRRAGSRAGRSRPARSRPAPRAARLLRGCSSSLETGRPWDSTCSVGVSWRIAMASTIEAGPRRSPGRSSGRAGRRRR